VTAPVLRALPFGEDFVILWGTKIFLGGPFQAGVPETNFAVSPMAASLAAQTGDSSLTREGHESNIPPFPHPVSMGELPFSGWEKYALGMVICGCRAPPWIRIQISDPDHRGYGSGIS